jgi:hypothetical protein
MLADWTFLVRIPPIQASIQIAQTNRMPQSQVGKQIFQNWQRYVVLCGAANQSKIIDATNNSRDVEASGGCRGRWHVAPNGLSPLQAVRCLCASAAVHRPNPSQRELLAVHGDSGMAVTRVNDSFLRFQSWSIWCNNFHLTSFS